MLAYLVEHRHADVHSGDAFDRIGYLFNLYPFLFIMEEPYCSDHKDQPAIAFCQITQLLYCLQCFEKHSGHNDISIIKYNQSKSIQLQALLLKQTAVVLTKTRLRIENALQAAEATLLNKVNKLNKFNGSNTFIQPFL